MYNISRVLMRLSYMSINSVHCTPKICIIIIHLFFYQKKNIYIYIYTVIRTFLDLLKYIQIIVY